jgi:pyridoxal phosphate enzyme (YggS family)
MLIGPQNLPENIGYVRDRIARVAAQCERSVDSVTLIAVSKGQPATQLDKAARLGLRHFGESYLQEALEKMQVVSERDITWHFIGGLQANKTRSVAENFAWVHSVDRLRIAERLSAQRPYHAPLLNVCVQVNVGGELSKGGASPEDVPALIEGIAKLERLKLRGLMCLPPEEEEQDRQRYWFAQLRTLFDSLNQSGAGLDTLSMGMSGDFEAAIREGATHVRVGTAIFGPRTHTMRSA